MSHTVSRKDTGLGEIDFGVMHSAHEGPSTSKRSKYTKWSDKDRYEIGKYTSLYGAAAAVRKFKQRFPSLNESTSRTFRNRVEADLQAARKKGVAPKKAIPKYSTKTGRPLILGEDLDSMVQNYLLAASSRGAVISRASAVSAAKALLKKYPNAVGNIDLDSSQWAKSLFLRMGFVKRRFTSTKVDIPEKARKEIEYQFHHDIVSKVERYNIPNSLIINLDQTPSSIVPGRKQTMALKGSSAVTIVGANDKRNITATFAVTLSGEFLPMQLIYGGKTDQSLPRFKFPDSFSLSVNEKHYSNTEESLKFFNELIIPYIKSVHSSSDLPEDQYSLVIMDVFTGQMTSDVLNLLRDNKILLTNVPPNMTKFYQPLDLTVNGYAKKFMARKFNDWYTHQVSTQLDKGVPIDEIDIKLRLSLLKPLHAGWLVNFYNHMTSGDAKKVIDSGWTSSGIKDAIRLGLNALPSIDPFNDIAPMMVQPNQSPVLHNPAIFDLTPEVISIGYSRNDNEEEDVDNGDETAEQDDESDDESDEEDIWGQPDRNIFDLLINDFDDEEDL